MSFFELKNETTNEEPVENNGINGIKDKIASFPPVRPRPNINLHDVDAAAAPHGFTSREPKKGRKRRQLIVSTEPTRHLAIRCPESLYKRFEKYADGKGLHYHDALEDLLNQVEQ
jgi:hypothetical protein